ncbi:hypothetical protein COOONC_27925 [Cooperia oncophora]
MSPLLRGYSRYLYRQPLIVAVVAVVLTGLLPLIVLYFRPIQLSQNAEVGFDTKDTDLSGQRLAWQKMQQTLQRTNRIVFANRPPLYPDAQANASKEVTARKRARRSWADELLNTFNKVPCYDAPIPFSAFQAYFSSFLGAIKSDISVNYLTQVVIEVPNLSSIFDPAFLHKMCSMHDHIAAELSAFDNYTPYRNVWSIANFVSCLSPNFLFNCTELSAADVDTVRNLINYCVPYRDRLIACQVACKDNPSCPSCREVPSNCSSIMMFDLFYRLLPRDLDAQPLHLNTFLPVFTLTGYATQNIALSIDPYNRLEKAIVRFMEHEHLLMKGINHCLVFSSLKCNNRSMCVPILPKAHLKTRSETGSHRSGLF